MSETPPLPDPNEAPPPQYVEYPRGQQAVYGSPEKLMALWEGYSGLNYVFILNVVLAIGGRALTLAPIWEGSPPEAFMVYYGVYFLILFSAIGACSYPYNKKIAFGKDWPPSNAITASILVALVSWVCCGIIGFAVMQQIALMEMKRYGIKPGLMLRKRDVEAKVAELRAAQFDGGVSH